MHFKWEYFAPIPAKIGGRGGGGLPLLLSGTDGPAIVTVEAQSTYYVKKFSRKNRRKKDAAYIRPYLLLLFAKYRG